MKYFLLLILLFSGCETYRVIDTPSGPLKVYETGRISGATKYIINGCAIDAVLFESALDAETLLTGVVWKRKLIVEYDHFGTLKAHIWVLYMYPPGDNQLWAWDRTGSKRVRAYIDNPEQIARQLINQKITKAFYVEEL